MDKPLSEILAEKGLAETMAEWRSRRAPLADERNRMLCDLRSLEQKLLTLDEEFAKVSQQTEPPGIVTSADTSSTEGGVPYEALNGPDLVLAILRRNGGRMKSRLLYIEAEKHGKQRQTTYVTVSKLIAPACSRRVICRANADAFWRLPKNGNYSTHNQ